MKRKTFLTTLIGGLALLPVAIKEAAAQLRKPKLSIKDGDEYMEIKPVESLDYDSDCPIVMLRGVGASVVGAMTDVTYTAEFTRKIICEIKLTIRNAKWLGNNLDETIKVDCDKFKTECLITNRKIVGDKIVLRMES